jgi:hypothetical protein
MELVPKSKLKIEEPYLTEAKTGLYVNLPQLWDPTESINLERIKSQCINLEAQYKYLQHNPNVIKYQYKSGIIVGVIGTLIGILPLLFYSIQVGFYFICISWFYLIAQKSFYTDITKDIIKLQLANKKNWLFDPLQNKTKWSHLKKMFPLVFKKGDQNQRVENMFWGNFLYNNKSHYFHAGELSYDIQKLGINGKYRKVKQTEHYIIVYNEKNIHSTFMLIPETFKSKFNKKEIKTESHEFNRRYSFVYEGSKFSKELNIVKILSPAVQEKLLTLCRKNEDISILFHKNTIVFNLKGPMFKEIHTNFKNNSAIDQRDIDLIDSKLTNLTEISSGIIKYLD